MFVLLSEKKDRTLVQQWGVWLTKQDSERAIKLLTSLSGGRRQSRQEDDLALLQQIQESDASAGAQYLEHLVLQKRSQVMSWMNVGCEGRTDLGVFSECNIAHTACDAVR